MERKKLKFWVGRDNKKDGMYVMRYAPAWNNKGNALGNLGRNEEALKSYDKALEIDPKYALAWNNKGNALGNLGRHEEAIKSCEKALEIAPGAVLVRGNLKRIRDILRPRRELRIVGFAVAGVSGGLLIACLTFYFLRLWQVASGNNLSTNPVEIDIMRVLIPTFLAGIFIGLFLPYFKTVTLPGGVTLDLERPEPALARSQLEMWKP